MSPDNNTNDASSATPADPDVYRYDIGDDERPSHAVVTVAAVLRGRDPTRMAPLADEVDLDALDRLLANGDGAQCAVTLALGPHALTLHGDEKVVVRDRHGPARGPHDEGLSP